MCIIRPPPSSMPKKRIFDRLRGDLTAHRSVALEQYYVREIKDGMHVGQELGKFKACFSLEHDAEDNGKSTHLVMLLARDCSKTMCV